MKNLPLNGRSYDQLLTLNPATVNYTAQRSGSIGTSNSSVGNMFSVSGRRPQDNLYLLNGVEYTGASLINVTPGGTSGQLLGVDAVREFNVSSDTYSAAFGKRQGAQISIVTASGSNQLHGAAYEFLRNSALDARNYFDQQQIPEFQRNNFGGSLGGPIRRDKVFLFGNYEGYRQNLGLSNVALVPDANARQGLLPTGPGGSLVNVGLAPGVSNLLQLWPTPNGPELTNPSTGQPTGIAVPSAIPKQTIREDFGTARSDYNLGAKDLLFGVYTIDDSIAHTPTPIPSPSSTKPCASRSPASRSSTSSLRACSTRRASASRAHRSTSSAAATVDVPGFVSGRPVGAIVISGSTASNGASQITGAGGNVGSNNAVARNLFTFDDHIYWTFGRHQIEVGGWLQRLQSNDNLAQNQDGQASFATLADIPAGHHQDLHHRPRAHAAQLALLVRRRLCRRCLEGNAAPRTPRRPPRRNQQRLERIATAAPRTTSSPTASSTPTPPSAPPPSLTIAQSSCRSRASASHGIPSATAPPRCAPPSAWITACSTTSTTASTSPRPTTQRSATPAPRSPIPINGKGTISPSSVQTDIATPSTLAWTLKLEQQVAPQTSLTLAYVGSHSYHQILSQDQNEPAFVICPTAACPASLAAGTIYYPTTTKANPAAHQHHLVGLERQRQLQRARSRRAPLLRKRPAVPRQLHLVEESRQRLRMEHQRLRQHARLRQRSAASRSRLGPRRHGHAPHRLPQRHPRICPSAATAASLPTSTPSPTRAISGWTLSAISNLQSGFPFTPQLGYNPTGSGDTRNPVRPDVNPNFHGSLYAGGSTAARANQFFNPAAFLAPAAGAVGNLRRDTLTGPGFTNLDLSLAKSTTIHERVRAQFRAEFFNVLNHTNLMTPNPVVFSSGPQQSTSAATRTQPAVAQSHSRSRHRRSHQPPNPVRIEAAVLDSCIGAKKMA